MNLNISEKITSLLKDPLHRNAIYLMGDSVITSALGFVFWVVAARFYAEGDVGMASTIISALGLLAIASTLGFSVGLIRFLPESRGEEYSRIINSCFTLSGILALVLAVIFILGLDVWLPSLNFLKSDMLFVFVFMIFTLTWTFSILLNSLYISARRSEYVFIKNSMMASTLKLSLLVILSYLAVNLTFSNIYYSWAVAALLAVIFSAYLFIKKTGSSYKPRISLEKDSISPLMRYSAGNYIATFFYQIPLLVLPLMLTNILGTHITAFFYLTWMMANLLFIIPSAVGTSLLSEMSHEESRYEENIKKASKFITLLLIPGIILFLLVGDTLLLIFGSSYSANASFALKIFAISSIPLAINSVYITVKNAKKQVRYVILVNAATALSTLLVSYLVMGTYGLNGIAVTWLVCQSAVAVAILFNLMIKYGKNNPKRSDNINYLNE
jgi:O-antigen/teichoic acid export membrane protein